MGKRVKAGGSCVILNSEIAKPIPIAIRADTFGGEEYEKRKYRARRTRSQKRNMRSMV